MKYDFTFFILDMYELISSSINRTLIFRMTLHQQISTDLFTPQISTDLFTRVHYIVQLTIKPVFALHRKKAGEISGLDRTVDLIEIWLYSVVV